MGKRAIGAIWSVVFLAVCPVVAAEELPPKIMMDCGDEAQAGTLTPEELRR